MNIAILRPGSSLVPNFLFPACTKTQGNWTEHQARGGSGVVIGTRLAWTKSWLILARQALRVLRAPARRPLRASNPWYTSVEVKYLCLGDCLPLCWLSPLTYYSGGEGILLIVNVLWVKLLFVLFQSATARMRFVRGTRSGAENVATVSCTRSEPRGVSSN